MGVVAVAQQGVIYVHRDPVAMEGESPRPTSPINSNQPMLCVFYMMSRHAPSTPGESTNLHS